MTDKPRKLTLDELYQRRARLDSIIEKAEREAEEARQQPKTATEQHTQDIQYVRQLWRKAKQG